MPLSASMRAMFANLAKRLTRRGAKTTQSAWMPKPPYPRPERPAFVNLPNRRANFKDATGKSFFSNPELEAEQSASAQRGLDFLRSGRRKVRRFKG